MEVQALTAYQMENNIVDETYSHLLASELKWLTPTKREFRLVVPGVDTVREVTNVLTPDECKAIIDTTSSASKSNGFSQPTGFLPKDRDCQRIHTVDKNMSDIMLPRLRPFLPEVVYLDGVRWRLSRFTHHWRYVRYYPGGHFSPHYDGAKMSSSPQPCLTVFTVQIYLNGPESFGGGSTRFYPDYKPERQPSHETDGSFVGKFNPHTEEKDYRVFAVEPEQGKALMFNHSVNTLHDGSPVTSGKKFIMRGDILYTAFEEDLHLLPEASTTSISTTVNYHWCPFTAAKHGTRNYVGDVWYCACALDQHGATVDANKCWHLQEDQEDTTSDPKAVVPVLKQILTSSNQKGKKPKLALLISGKRASGKDHIAGLIKAALSKEGFEVHRTALGNINKVSYAATVGIDAERLMNDRKFKEQHRIAMIKHHTVRNAQDPEWCLKEVFHQSKEADILLLSDLRTHADLQWFRHQPGLVTTLLRVNASEVARKQHGWDPCPVKDALHTETELDCYARFDACWDNSDDTEIGALLLEEWIRLTVVPRVKALLA